MDNLEQQLLDQIIWNEAGRAANNNNDNFDNENAEDDEDRDGDGTLDGGVARGPDDTSERKIKSKCDLVSAGYVGSGTFSTQLETHRCSFCCSDFLFGVRGNPGLLPPASYCSTRCSSKHRLG